MILPRGRDFKIYQHGWTLADHEKEIILQAFQTHGWNPTKVSRALDIGRSTLYRKIVQFGWMKRRLGFAPRTGI